MPAYTANHEPLIPFSQWLHLCFVRDAEAHPPPPGLARKLLKSLDDPPQPD